VLKNRSTLQKLLIAFGTVGILLVVMLATTQLTLSQIHSASAVITDQGITQIRLGDSLALWARTVDDDGGYYVLNGQKQWLQTFNTDVAQFG
jgi:CHASE3 domain sensor protein